MKLIREFAGQSRKWRGIMHWGACFLATSCWHAPLSPSGGRPFLGCEQLFPPNSRLRIAGSCSPVPFLVQIFWGNCFSRNTSRIGATAFACGYNEPAFNVACDITIAFRTLFLRKPSYARPSCDLRGGMFCLREAMRSTRAETYEVRRIREWDSWVHPSRPQCCRGGCSSFKALLLSGRAARMLVF